MTDKLTPQKIEEIGKHYENIQSGKTPILKSEKETMSAHLDVSNLMKKKEDKKVLPLIPPTDPAIFARTKATTAKLTRVLKSLLFSGHK